MIALPITPEAIKQRLEGILGGQFVVFPKDSQFAGCVRGERLTWFAPAPDGTWIHFVVTVWVMAEGGPQFHFAVEADDFEIAERLSEFIAKEQETKP